MNETEMKLIKQLRKVISLLQKRLEMEPNKLILKTLYERYTKAEIIISNNMNTEDIMIEGGCRAYIDSFSDYSNSILVEMNYAEELLQKIKGIDR